jgi:hypothetical protein
MEWPKSDFREKKLKIFGIDQANELIFFTKAVDVLEDPGSSIKSLKKVMFFSSLDDHF